MEIIIPIVIFCPKCKTQHIDEGEWSSIPHKTHLCGNCKYEWRPRDFHTVGIKNHTLEGFVHHSHQCDTCGVVTSCYSRDCNFSIESCDCHTRNIELKSVIVSTPNGWDVGIPKAPNYNDMPMSIEEAEDRGPFVYAKIHNEKSENPVESKSSDTTKDDVRILLKERSCTDNKHDWEFKVDWSSSETNGIRRYQCYRCKMWGSRKGNRIYGQPEATPYDPPVYEPPAEWTKKSDHKTPWEQYSVKLSSMSVFDQIRSHGTKKFD